MKFKELINKSDFLKDKFKNIDDYFKEIAIDGISNNSKEIKKNFIFFAFSGNKTNGNLYIKEAKKNGAAIIISEEEINNDVIKLPKRDFSAIYSHLCSLFYSKKPRNIIAVTGTNGKSSIADFYFQILNLNNKKVASIGTLGINTYLKKTNVKNTTLDPISLNYHLQKIKKLKINNIILYSCE